MTAVLLVLAAAGGAVAGPAAADPLQPSEKELRLLTERATAVALADPQVSAVVPPGMEPSLVVPWSTPTPAVGVTLSFEWPAADARSVADVWPLVVTEGSEDLPAWPLVTAEHRLRIADLSALRVDVLLRDPGEAAGRVIQLSPMDGETRYDLLEETWAPFSSLPWFTQHPWVLAPVFVLVGVLLVVRCWLRSRAWNRRLPSMTRHDRQFAGRVVILVFLLAGFAWQVYAAYAATRQPSVDESGFGAGELAALPLFLIPPGLYLAALALDLTPAPHRVAWGLVALLAMAGSAYYLATALTMTATNLNLGAYILLAILALIALPHAFSQGKTGWSRSGSAGYS